MVNNGGPAGGWGRLIKSRCCPLSERHAIPKKGPKSVCDDRLCRPAALPRFRASSKSREMLAFAHIPTSTTANTGIDRDDWKSRTVAAGSQRADRDRSRSQTRRGYTLRGGSGCRTFGVHLRHYKLSSAAHLCVPSRFERAQPGDRRDCWGTQQRQQPNATLMLSTIRCVRPQADLDPRSTVSSEKERRTSFLFGPERDGYFTQAGLSIFAGDGPVVAVAATSALVCYRSGLGLRKITHHFLAP
jgi:hypothetical protein